MWRSLRNIALGIVLMFAIMPSSAQAAGIKERVRFERFAKVTHLSSSGMNLWVDVTNDSCLRLIIKEMELDININNRCVATISLRDKVILPRRATTSVLLPLRFTSRSTFTLVRILWNIVDGLGDDISISYRVKAGTRLLHKRLSEENIPVSEILTNFAISKLRLRELIDML